MSALKKKYLAIVDNNKVNSRFAKERRDKKGNMQIKATVLQGSLLFFLENNSL